MGLYDGASVWTEELSEGRAEAYIVYHIEQAIKKLRHDNCGCSETRIVSCLIPRFTVDGKEVPPPAGLMVVDVTT